MVRRISHFNQTMPALVLNLESSAMSCSLALVKRLLDQWGILKYIPQSDVSLSFIGWEKSSRLLSQYEQQTLISLVKLTYFHRYLERIGQDASWPMRKIETFTSKRCIFIFYWSREKVAEFYYNRDSSRLLVWLNWIICIVFWCP